MKHHPKKTGAVPGEAAVSEVGLTAEEAKKRLAASRKSRRKKRKKTGLRRKFTHSAADPLTLLLLAASAIRAVLAVWETGGRFSLMDFSEPLTLLAAAAVCAAVSLIREHRTAAVLRAAAGKTAASARVLRDGKAVRIPGGDIVVGDIVLLKEGDVAPADCRVIESSSLLVEEAAPAGGASVILPVDALPPEASDGELPPDGENGVIRCGSAVIRGRGKAVAVAVGADTAADRTADAPLPGNGERTPLQKQTAELAKLLSRLLAGLCVIIFAVGLAEDLIFTGRPFSLRLLGGAALGAFLSAAALAVSASPKRLPSAATFLLSKGVTAMGRRQTLIRDLSAAETLGRAQVVCCDMTALTRNRMTVTDCYADDETLLATALALCSEAETDGEGVSGKPVDAALVRYANALSLNRNDLLREHPRVGEIQFDPVRKMSSAVHQAERGAVRYTKGAPEAVLDLCAFALSEGQTVRLTDELRQRILEENRSMADRALRVAACAMKKYPDVPADLSPDAPESDLVFVGLAGMTDPVRADARAAVDKCRAAGVVPVMLTDEQKDTAVAIAKELGILSDPSEAVSCGELDGLTDEELTEAVARYTVFARVLPEHKTRIAEAWKARGAVAVMTGGDVDDAPSVRAADVGVCMGVSGTDAVRAASGAVLADDSFASAVSAVEESRRLLDNFRNMLQFLLSVNIARVMIMFVSAILHFRLLSAAQLLWIHMATGFLPAMALGAEKSGRGLMRRGPRAAGEGLISRAAGVDLIWQSACLSIAELAAYFIGRHMENGTLRGLTSGGECAGAMAMAFLTVSFAEIFCAFSMRSRTGSLFSGSMFRHFNWHLFGACSVAAALTLAAVCAPGLREVFSVTGGTVPVKGLLVSFGLAFATLPVFELGKAVGRIVSRKK